MTRFITPLTSTRLASTHSPRMARWPAPTSDDFLTGLLDEFLGATTSGMNAKTMSTSFGSNKTDIWEEDGFFKVAMDVPGLEEKDLDVTVNNGILTLKAEKSDETSDEGKSFIQRERSFTAFERQIALPEGIDEEKVSAHLAHGVLTLSLPKLEVETKKMRKVSIISGKYPPQHATA